MPRSAIPRPRAAHVFAASLAIATLVPAAASARAATSRVPSASPTSPVNLATPVNFAQAIAAHDATVTAGDARFEVLGGGLIRLEYSPTGTFGNMPTVNVLDRRFPVPRFAASATDGWLTIRTAEATLRYRLGSGPFTPANTSLSYELNGNDRTARPAWDWECPFGQVCQSGAAALSGGANLAANHANYESTAGFIQNLGQGNGATATWQVLGAPAGPATVTVRYANYIGAIGGPAPRTIDLTVNGMDVKTLTLPPTASWDDWSAVSTTVPLTAGTNQVGVTCAAADSCNVNVDTLSVAAPGSPAPAVPAMGYLGGWTRSFDNATYGPGYSCPKGTPTASRCTAALPVMHSGLLDRAGYRLLDDTPSAEWTKDGWVRPRPAGGDVQDGYLFVYGQDYRTALGDLARLTGPAPLPPESAFGVWYSRYYPYTAADYENSLIPALRASNVPLDTLSVDTDWKAPNQWDGWEWNPALFPDPQAFLAWAKSQGINVTLNIHSSISDSDPKLSQAEAIAGNTLANSNCFSGACKVWDWSQVPQAESNFALQQPFESQGTAFWWLDWCCDNSTVSMPGLTPDNWIDHLYAQEMINSGERGFVLGRIGTSFQNPDVVYPAGPWSARTSAIHFTGDTWGTWNTLAFQAELAPDEATIGLPYVSDDIGSFLGPPPGTPGDDPDLYARWVQLGAFQPLLRLHSNHGNRLPWDYPQPANDVAASFLRLREALVPYTYTLASQATASGLPITRPLYLDYPGQPAAYSSPDEYLYGPDVLVAPVTTPGNVARQNVWFPPGRWVDWFTGATFDGPSTQTLTVPLDRMPVFVRAGVIVPEQPGTLNVSAAAGRPVTLRVFSGASGQFSLYQDAGTGLGYTRGERTTTIIRNETGDAGYQPRSSCEQGQAGTAPSRSDAASSTVIIGPACGSYPGEPATRAFEVQLVNLSQPREVRLNGRALPRVAPGGGDGWWYDASAQTVDVALPASPAGRPLVITQKGGSAVTRPEPAAAGLTIGPAAPLTLNPGQSAQVTTTVADKGPGALSDVSVGLTAPRGWTVTPGTQLVPIIADGGSATQPWTVTAPAGAQGPQTAALQATAGYISAGSAQSVTASEQAPPAPAPQPPPAISNVQPASGNAGTAITITGQNFGASQGSSYLFLADLGTSWGAPFDGATLTITSWSDTSVTFVLPSPQGPNGVWHLVPGTTATVTVNVNGSASNAAQIAIS
ncbi:MAG: DUF5110 domain-containing protein [Streptosporangiaceae bacterium]|nr:DUF5110 domain-containing protein [Streptosporangiaceae bacterium]MBV9854240.1 DUF5110 domain-containing protein [Streptosporangiaceae bacterium]